MKYFVAIYTLAALAAYDALLSYGTVMASLGDGTPHPVGWDIFSVFPFMYFTFLLISCVVKHPSSMFIKVSISMQALILPYLLFLLFSEVPMAGIFILGLVGFWLLMFLDKCGVIHLETKHAFAGIGIVLLVLTGVFLLVYAIAYLKMKLLSESIVFMGGALLSGVISYFLLMKFAEKVKVVTLIDDSGI